MTGTTVDRRGSAAGFGAQLFKTWFAPTAAQRRGQPLAFCRRCLGCLPLLSPATGWYPARYACLYGLESRGVFSSAWSSIWAGEGVGVEQGHALSLSSRVKTQLLDVAGSRHCLRHPGAGCAQYRTTQSESKRAQISFAVEHSRACELVRSTI